MSHEPGHVTSPDANGGGDSAIGQALFDLQGQRIGQLLRTNAGFVYILGPRGQVWPFEGGTFLNGLGRALLIGDTGDILDERILPQPPRSTGGSRALTLADQQALLEQQQEFQAGQTAGGQVFQTSERVATQAFQEEAAALAEENAQRSRLQGQAASLLEQWLAIQGQARQFLTEIQGQDPFRAAAGASGQVTRGVTPQQAHEANLRATVGQELTFDSSGNVGALQGQVDVLRHQVGTGLPEVPAFVGAFGHGGTIDMEAGDDGVFRAKGQSAGGFRDVRGRGPVSFLVGEEGKEIVTIRDGQVTVTPFAGGFSHGGSFQLPSNASLLQASSSIFGELGFENIPTTSFDRSGFQRPLRRTLPAGLDLQGIADFERARPADFGFQALQRLGIQPRLVRNDATGAVFFRADDGRFLHIPDMAAFRRFGFNPNEVVSLSPESIAALGVPGTTGGGVPQLTQLSDIGTRTEFGPQPFPLLAPIGNQQVPIPDPRLLARLFGRLDVAGKRNLLSLYGVTPGVTADSALERIRFFTPQGRAQPGTTASLK